MYVMYMIDAFLFFRLRRYNYVAPAAPPPSRGASPVSPENLREMNPVLPVSGFARIRVIRITEY
jgi:hypothetical protein